MKTWKPDTCDCVVEEVYNGTQIIGGGQVLRKCEDHSEVTDEELYGVLYSNPDGENKRKNLVYKFLLENKALNLSEVVPNKEGQMHEKLKDGVGYDWSFEGTGKNRKLKVNIKGVTLQALHKKQIKDFGDETFGPGKVEII